MKETELSTIQAYHTVLFATLSIWVADIQVWLIEKHAQVKIYSKEIIIMNITCYQANIVFFADQYAFNSYQCVIGNSILQAGQKSYQPENCRLGNGNWRYVTTTIGVAVALSGGLDCAYGSTTCGNNQTLADILTITGGAAMLGSIPLFIAASKNKKRL